MARFKWIFACFLILFMFLNCGKKLGKPAAEDGWLTFRGSLANLGAASEALQGPLKLAMVWEFKNKIRSTIAAQKGSVFISDWDGKVHCLDAINYQEKWQTKVQGYFTGSPALVDNQLVIGNCDTNVYAFSVKDGHLLWSFPTHQLIISSPQIAGKLLVIGSHDGFLYALDWKNGQLKWKFQTGGLISSTPAFLGNDIFVGSGSPGVFRICAQTGRLVWHFKTAKTVVASPVAARGKVFFGDYSGNFYVVSQLDGRLLWQVRSLAKIDASAAFANGNIYWADMAGVLYAAKAATGEPLWQFPVGGPVISSLLVDSENIYIARYRQGRIFMLRQRDGTLIWTYGLDGNAYASPIIYRGRLYIGTEKGKLYAFASQEKNSPKKQAKINFRKLLKFAKRVPPQFRRHPEDRWKRFDVPPVPKGGYVLLQQRLQAFQQTLPQGFSGLTLVKALVSEQGDVLRVSIARACGNDQADSTAMAVVRSLSWQPAMYRGRPFKTDVWIPVRFFHPSSLTKF